MWSFKAPGAYEGIPMSTDEIETIAIRIKVSNLPLLTRETHRFGTWRHDERTEDAFQKTKAFLEAPSHHFLSLLGGVGLGKSHLAIALAWDWLEKGKGAVLYYQVESLLDELRKGYRAWEKGDEVDPYLLIEQAKNCHLCILDDLGAHKETEWSSAKLDAIIDFRYINRRATVITSNLSLDLLPERISDRLAEGEIVFLTGQSYRRKGK